ncbi:MAG: hypothetical protein ABI301_05415 [Jatrophihabitantaceae bacterium]
MNSALSGIPVPRRRQLAATLGLFAVLFLAVGAVATTGGGSALVRVFSALALLVAAVLGLIAWGVAHSIKIDQAEMRLDAAIEDTISANGGPATLCGCGHDHDPDELHVTDACDHDGRGADCTQNCDTCVLAAMRPSPTRPRTERLSH